MRNILVTSALPYANGHLHLGHMLGYIQSDIWVRYQKMKGNNCYYVCGSDTHGTPIMLKAKNDKIKPERLVHEMSNSHRSDFIDFGIEFDNYHSTHNPLNQKMVEEIYLSLRKNDLIEEREIEQAYDPKAKMFLPDRFVKGECPKCNATNQYGDNCEVCGATYSPLELINPLSVVSDTPPIKKTSLHFFFKLNKQEKILKNWIYNNKNLQPEVINKLKEWLESGLQDWDISRDEPYFGYKIPDTKDKYFYVWLDAPIGYLASFKNMCEGYGIDYNSFWSKNSPHELYHFIGKDIIYFHTLFWPAVLNASNHRLPTGVYANGFVTINGQKMSKSRGTFIKARTYLDYLDAEYLRYYFASKLSSGIEDIDINLEDLVLKVNSDIVGKVVNIASRCSGFIHRISNGMLSDSPDIEIINNFISEEKVIADLYEKREFSQAIKNIMSLSDKANQYIQEKQPWKLAKSEGNELEVQRICSTGINLFKILIIFLKPVLPKLSEKAENFLRIYNVNWNSLHEILISHTIEVFKPMMFRIEKESLELIINDTYKEHKSTPEKKNITKKSSKQPHENENHISIEDFMKVELRIGKILKANTIDGANKLLKLEVDIGENKTKQIFSAIKENYTSEDLTGKLTVVVTNLAPREMKFGLSEGMVLASSDKNGPCIISPEKNMPPGTRVK